MRFLVLLLFYVSANAQALIAPSSTGTLLFNKNALGSSSFVLSFEERNYVVNVDRRTTILNTTIVEGAVENDRFSYFNIACETTCSGTLSVEGKNFAFTTTQEGTASLQTPSKELQDRPIEVNGTQDEVQTKALGTKEDGSVIDVLALYTTNANSNSDINSSVASAIAYANKALENSCASFRYRLVGVHAVNYAETNNMITDLNASYYGTIKDFSNVTIHQLRDSYAADLVMLWVGSTNYNFCGLAYVNDDTSYSSASAYGYSVVLKPLAACPIETAAHELGHNMGASHDRYTEEKAKDDFTTYRGYGFIDLLHTSNSVMSYGKSVGTFVSECKKVTGSDCTTVPYFSNPNIIRDGVIFGLAGSADAIGVMNDNRVNIANFRQTKDANYSFDQGSCQDIKSTQKGITNCFVATVAFGSYLDSEVVFLRDFRDEVLLDYAWGEAFVAWYYEEGPKYAHFISEHEYLKALVRAVLYLLVVVLSHPVMTLSLFLVLMTLFVLRAKRGKACV